MSLFHLTIVRPDGREIDQDFTSDQTMVGRHDKCDLRLVDSMVSRNHCIILREDKRFLIKDLESRNGTWVNGRRIKNRRRIEKGDVIQVGPFRIVFEPNAVSKGPAPQLTQTQTLDMTEVDQNLFVHRDESERVVKPLGMISNYLSETAGALQRVPTKIRRERLNRNLLTLYRITEELVVTKNLDEILTYIMDQMFEIFTPSQAVILLREQDGMPVPVRQKSAEGKGSARNISQTIIRRILEDRVAILTDNALEDPRFEMGESVIIDGIRSVMAAPIWEERAILGVLYIDSLDVVGGYKSEDLDLLTAIGHQAALAIQRWTLTEKLRQEAVKSAVIRLNLSRFHSPPVVDLIMKGAADLEAKETEATVFFCDIVDSTTLSASVSPSRLRQVLNLFFKLVNDVVFDEQGTLDKFIGDAALAIYGAPLPQEDAPVRAIRSAIQIRDRLAEETKFLRADLRIQVRYGINTGSAVVGNFGSDERMDYTILGHAVNVASRICGAADPDQILVGPETYEKIKDLGIFNIKPIHARRLKGVKGKTKLYEIVGMQ